MAARKRRAPRSEGELTRAGAVIQFIEEFLLVPEGAKVGQRVELLDFQKEIIRGIYDGDTRRAIVSFGRKNGKTSLTAMLEKASKAWHGVKLNEPDWSDHSHTLALCGELRQEGLLFHFIRISTTGSGPARRISRAARSPASARPIRSPSR